MLDDPNPVQVSGDRTAGVMRASGDSQIEAYSWGALTGRSQSRALWLLVLPFALINLAGWMTWKRDRALHRALVRSAGLAMTALYVLFTAAITMDFLAYQCAGASGCAAASWPVVGDGGMADNPARRAVIGAIGPLLVVGLLAALTRTSRRRYEQWDEPDPPPRIGRDPAQRGLPDSDFWNGQAYAASLARVHHFAGLAIVALLLSASAATVTDSPVAPALTVGIAVLLLAACGLALVSRLRQPIPRPVPLLVGAGLVVVAAVAAWTGTPTGEPPPRPLPGILYTFDAVLGVLYMSVLFLLVGGGHVKLQPNRWSRLRERLTPFAVSVLAALLAPTFLAGTALWVARWLGSTASVGQPDHATAAILYPQPYEMLARALVPIIIAGLVIALAAAAVAWWTTEEESMRRLRQAWPSAVPGTRSAVADQDWLRRVSAALRIPRASLAAVEWTVWTLGVLITAGTLVYSGYWTIRLVSASNRHSYLDIDLAGLPLPPLGFSVWTLTVLPLLAVMILRQGLRNPSTRRRIAIAWDVVTFWPRSFHPLCPPSYAERAVPEIKTRLARIWDAGGAVVLLAHSQGSVLATAAVAGLPPDRPGVADRLSVISYGNPTNRLFARHFPSYVDDTLLDTVAAKVVGWRNFYRDTDYIGYRMRQVDPILDVYLPDPATNRYYAGDQLPQIRGHAEKGYRRQSQFADYLRDTVSNLRKTLSR
jgi:hypothetical protein